MRWGLGVVLVATLVTVLVTGVPAAAGPRAGHASPAQEWTYVNRGEPDRSYWSDDRTAGVLAGPLTEPRGMFRSLLRFDTTPLAGSRIHGVAFRITMDRSTSCRPTPVDLWRTAAIDPATPLSWRGSRDHWLGGAPLASASGHACDGQYDFPLEFSAPELTALVQEAADSRAGTVSLGLRVPNERDPRQGKVFHPETAFLVVNYNNPPNAPRDLGTRPPTACGTATAPTPVTASTSRTYTTVASDPDHDNLHTTLELSRPDGTVVHTSEVGATASGAAFQWPELPQGVLAHGETYRYRAWSDDRTDVGPATEYCHIAVDAVAPAVPTISSTDFPDGEPVLPARTTGTVTFRVADPNEGVTEFLYGFQRDRVTLRVPVSEDGSATIPVTVADPAGASLYVRAADAAGNISPVSNAWDLQAFDNPAPPADVPGDVTGDGRPDVAAVLGHHGDRTTVWNVTAREGGFHTGVAAFDTGTGGNDLARFLPTRGDFTGDGRTDLAMLRRGSGDTASLWLLASDGNRYNATTAWTSTGPFPFTTTRLVSGDFTGDGTDDVAAQVARAGGWEVLVFPGGALHNPVTWYTGGTNDWPSARIVAADTDGDGREDLVELRAHDGCRTTVLTHRSTGTAFEPGVSNWDGAACPGATVAGDVDGDGRDDLVALGNDGAVTVFPAASGYAPSEWWRGGQLLPTAAPSVGDFDLDGRQDLAVVQSCCTEGETQLWTLRSTGTAFAAPVLGWSGRTGGTLPPSR